MALNLAAKRRQNSGNALKPKALHADEPMRQKLMSYGAPGTGKTAAIIGFLEADLKVFAISTEAGGNGFRTIKSGLKSRNGLALLESFQYLDLSTYDDVLGFLEEASNPESDLGKALREFQPDLLAWDGFSNFQVNIIDEFVLDKDYAGTAGKIEDMRSEGLVAGEKDWDAIARCSRRILHKFSTMEINGKLPHIYLNCWEMDPAEDSPGRKIAEREKVYRPYLVGGTRHQISGYFDFTFRTTRRNKAPTDKTLVYEYVFAAPDCVSKQREFTTLAIEPADMAALWAKLA